MIESVRRLHRPGPASPPRSSTFTRSSPTMGGSVVVVGAGGGTVAGIALGMVKVAGPVVVVACRLPLPGSGSAPG